MKIIDIHEQGNPHAAEDMPEETYFTFKDDEWITSVGYGFLVQKIEKLNKRALKLKLPAIQIIKLSEEFRPKDPDNPDSPKLKYFHIKIQGESPKLPGGWEFIATIEHTPNGNLIRTVPGYEHVEGVKDFYDARPEYCDQCKKVRNRIDTFIVKNEEGHLRQIGRNCLKDFLGGQSPAALLWYASTLGKLGDFVNDAEKRGGGGGRREEEYVEPVKVIAGAAAAVRNYGYRKSSMGYSGSTANMVRLGMFMYDGRQLSQEEREWGAITSHPTPDDIKNAQELIVWFNALPPAQKQEPFMHNVDVVINSSGITSRDIGYAVALLPVHARAMGLIKQKEEAANKSNEWIGTVGQKIPPTKVKVVRTRMISGDFGTFQLVVFEDEPGNTLVWFNSGKKDVQPNQEMTIVGKVKKQDVYQDRKQTTLTRVKTV